ncbi:MAG: nickel-binding protein [Candidatus Hodarchaeales archaeon]|jgi:hypothetical protein
MPQYVDAHPISGVTSEQLKEIQNADKDEFGVTHINILYNLEEGRAVCILDAPSKDAVHKHHKKMGLDCDFITKVDSTA